jgi:ribosomal protein S5
MPVYKHEQSKEEKALSKMKKGARRKGADFERELVVRFNEDLKDFHAVRNLQTKGGRGKADVRLTGSIHEFHVEAKRGKRTDMPGAIRQAVSEAKFGTIPVAITKEDQKSAYAIMELDDFIAILQALEGIETSGTVILKVPKGIRYQIESED